MENENIFGNRKGERRANGSMDDEMRHCIFLARKLEQRVECDVMNPSFAVFLPTFEAAFHSQFHKRFNSI